MRSSPEMKLGAVLFALLLFPAMPHADFSSKSLSVMININPDGSANVEEQLDIIMNGTDSRALYETTRTVYSDISTWKDRTQLPEMRQHISGAKAAISDIRITPQAVERCNSFIGTCHALFILDYKVTAAQNGSGLVRVEHYKPRTANYSIQADALSFEQTKTGDLILPAGTQITITVPSSAERIYFSSMPSSMAGNGTGSLIYDSSTGLRYYAGPERSFTWQDNTLSKFQFTYEIESPLEDEVISFFSDTQNATAQLLFGPQGIAAFILIATGALTFYYFNSRIRRK